MTWPLNKVSFLKPDGRRPHLKFSDNLSLKGIPYITYLLDLKWPEIMDSWLV